MAKQLVLIKEPRKNTKLWWIEKSKVYGGSMNYRKVRRPFDSEKLTHVVFKAKLGSAIWFTRSQSSIAKLVSRSAYRYGVKIRDLSINKDHIHILFDVKNRLDHICFLRFFACEMGRKYNAIRARLGVKSVGSLWVARPFSRLVSWGRKSVQIVRNYIQKNRNETMGFVEYRPRKHRLNLFLALWQESLKGAPESS